MSVTLDRGALDSLRVLETPDNPFLTNLINTYLSTSEKIVEDLVAAAKSGDLKNMGEIAHSLKSSSASLGAIRLSEMCFELEKIGRENLQNNDYANLANEAQKEFSAVKVELQKELK